MIIFLSGSAVTVILYSFGCKTGAGMTLGAAGFGGGGAAFFPFFFGSSSATGSGGGGGGAAVPSASAYAWAVNASHY